jgi:hypothetical protein
MYSSNEAWRDRQSLLYYFPAGMATQELRCGLGTLTPVEGKPYDPIYSGLLDPVADHDRTVADGHSGQSPGRRQDFSLAPQLERMTVPLQFPPANGTTRAEHVRAIVG